MSTPTAPPPSDVDATIGMIPFPGLRSFGSDESHLFFGREEQIDAVLWKLARNRFVSIVGTSGSGKSSLVRAGILPALRQGFVAQGGSDWRVAVMRPGSEPIRNLARALEFEHQRGESTGTGLDGRAEEILSDSPLGLVQLVRESGLTDGSNLLVLVDQFEELFRFKENERIEGAAEEASAFVALLLEAVAQRDLPIHVMLTLRSDFLGDCAQFHDLPEAINDGQYLIPRLRREQIRRAITGPVAVGGGKIAPRLVQQLLDDVGDDPDQLPILQHALMRTWEVWQEDHEPGEPIDLRHYAVTGGMRRALSEHADEAWNELPDERSRRICEAMFKSLAELGVDNRGVRRPTRLGEVAQIARASTTEVADVVEHFRRPGRTFIMPPHPFPLGAETVLDVSHESLMRVWQRLDAWVEEDARSAQTYRRIVESALLYQEGQAGLWHDPDLQMAEEWREREKPTEAWGARHHTAFAAAMSFLDRSVEHREALQREARRRRHLARFLALLFLVCAGSLSVWALSERSDARDNLETARRQGEIAQRRKSEAERQRNVAQQQRIVADSSRKVADQQRSRAEEQRTIAERQRKAAEEQRREALAQRQRAEGARREAVASRDVAESQRRTAVEQQKIAERERLRAESLADSISRARMLSIAQGLSRSVELGRHPSAEVGALLALQAYRFHRASGGARRDPDIYGALLRATRQFLPSAAPEIDAHAAAVRALQFTADGRGLYSAGSDGRLLLSTLQSPGVATREITRSPRSIRSLALSPSGNRLVFVDESGVMGVVAATAQEAEPLRAAGGELYRVAFVDQQKVATFGAGGEIEVVDLEGRGVVRRLTPGERPTTIAVSPEGSLIAAGTAAGVVSIWSMRGADSPRRISTGGGRVTALAFDGSGRLAVAFEKGGIRLYAVDRTEAPPILLAGQRSTVNAIAISSRGLLAAGGSDGSVRVWDLARPTLEPTLVPGGASWVWAVAFSPEGDRLAMGGFDRTIRVVPIESESLVPLLESRVSRNLDRQEWEQFIGRDLPYQRTVERIR